MGRRTFFTFNSKENGMQRRIIRDEKDNRQKRWNKTVRVSDEAWKQFRIAAAVRGLTLNVASEEALEKWAQETLNNTQFASMEE
jgi:hypothetical protein